MNSVGIDLHRRRSHVAALDEHGKQLLSRRIVNDSATFLELLAEIDGESKIALEATYGWEWLAELLEDHGDELHLGLTPTVRSSDGKARLGTSPARARWRCAGRSSSQPRRRTCPVGAA
jgi:hypothetical protein